MWSVVPNEYILCWLTQFLYLMVNVFQEQYIWSQQSYWILKVMMLGGLYISLSLSLSLSLSVLILSNLDAR